MIKFEKVSFEQFKNDLEKMFHFDEETVREFYNDIKLPERSTSGSAGYDFFAWWDFDVPSMIGVEPKDYRTITFPSGIRFVTDRDDIVLVMTPRSGQGFKYGMRLLNTVGVIDSDYQYSDNEGHIMARFIADIPVSVTKGQAYMQGIILPYFKVDEDNVTTKRNGGFGSTDKKEK